MEEARRCAVCGRLLPNRWAVAGKCAEDGCDAVFCALHYHNGNHRCPEHGWRAAGILARNINDAAMAAKEIGMEEEEKIEQNEERTMRSEAAASLTPEAKRSILKSLVSGVASLGAGAVKLVNAIRGVRDPEEAIRAFDAQLELNRARREPLARHHAGLYAKIAAGKKAYETAAPARRSLLEMELRTQLSEYKSEERQLKIYLENELTINAVRGRTLELVAMGLRKIKESQIDDVTDEIEVAAAEAEDVSGALVDLEKAGMRRTREQDRDAFLEELAGFEAAAVEQPAPAADAASAGKTPEAEPLDLSGF